MAMKEITPHEVEVLFQIEQDLQGEYSKPELLMSGKEWYFKEIARRFNERRQE